MKTITIETTKKTEGWEKGCFRADGTILMIKGVGGKYSAGHAVGGWDHTAEYRTISSVDKVRGPQAYTFELASVMDQNGGTGRIHDQAKAAGKFFEVEAGDHLILDGVEYVLETGKCNYTNLKPLSA